MHEHRGEGVDAVVVVDLNSLVLGHTEEYPGVLTATALQRREDRTRQVVEAVIRVVKALDGLGVVAVHGAVVGIHDSGATEQTTAVAAGVGAGLAVGISAAATVGGFVEPDAVVAADDFATARRSYGPLLLAFAFAATTASGATFVGFPGIAYEAGLAAVWAVFLYPAGVYLGVLVCLKVVSNTGHEFGSRSIPEYLGTRYQSDWLRVLVSLFSLLLLFYLAGQLVSGIVMFEIMLGVPSEWALGITAGVLMVYVVLGGAHADILTDGVQGFIMVAVAVGVGLLFVTGYGLEGGFSGMLASLERQDPNLVGWLNPDHVLFHSWWSLLALLLSHIPLGMLPHIGNKLWALERPQQRRRFILLASTFGLILGMLGLGGVLARATLGDALLQPGETSNMAFPMLFIELFPSWLVAMLGVAVLAAVMSTADGLVVSSSQIIANDLYRCTFVPRFAADVPERLYLEGTGSFEFERTASRLREMQDADWGQDHPDAGATSSDN